jgi:hypothetical protein
MTRKLLAIFALLSGLAALTGPANASLAHSSSACNASVQASTDSSVAAEQARAEIGSEQSPARNQSEAATPRSPVPSALGLPVLMGVDRALE